MAQKCQAFIQGSSLWHWALCGMLHSTHEEGKGKAGCCGKRSPCASPEHPMHCVSSACPLSFPGEGDSPVPFLFPGAGQSLLPTVYYHTKTLWHSPCYKKWCGGESEAGGHNATMGMAMRPLPTALLCPAEPQGSLEGASVFTKDISAPVQVQNEPCRLV